MGSSGVYGGVSAGERTAARRARLLEAALELLGTQGWARTTVRGVCREARLTPRFFYESFDDLDALAVAVFDDVVATALGGMLEAVQAAGDDPRARAEAAIGTWVRGLTDDPRRARVVFVEALGSEALMQRRLHVLRDVARLVGAQAEELYHPPPEAARLVDVTAAMLAGGIAELMVLWLQGELAVTRDQLVEDCVAVFVATAEGAAAVGRRRSAGRRGGA
jgi:AcrR family transcriptional regulator